MLEVERELTSRDIFRIATEPLPRIGPPVLKRLHTIHHRIARMVANGERDIDIAFAVGRTPQRIHDLKVDPAFIELVAYYEEQIIDVEAESGQRFRDDLLHVSELAKEEITDRLEDPSRRAAIPVSELRQLVQLGADRTVAPPRTAIAAQNAPVEITFQIAGRGLDKPEDDPIDVTPIPALESKP